MPKTYNVFISFDLEGVSIVTSWREMNKDSPSFQAVRECATEEVSAAIKGVRKTRKLIGEVCVCDSHAQGENLIVQKLPRGITVVKGSPRRYYMVEGLDDHFDILFCIGYHAMVGTSYAGMDHTYSSSLLYGVKINGKLVGETEINAAVAGYYGVPLGLVSGDDLLAKEVERFFGHTVEAVVTKYGISRFAARCRHPLDVQKEIEQKAQKAVLKISKLKPFTFKTPIRAEFEVMNSLVADEVGAIPGLKRKSARSLTYKAQDILEFYRILRLICSCA
jgi:D-amino peptidase